MNDIFIDNRLGIFFGVLVLFFSVSGILGYIPKQLVINTWFLVLFIIGVILGGMLIERGISPYFLPRRTIERPFRQRKGR